MKEGLNRLFLAYDTIMKRIRRELNRQLKGCDLAFPFPV